jgi:hypothetical protein
MLALLARAAVLVLAVVPALMAATGERAMGRGRRALS